MAIYRCEAKIIGRQAKDKAGKNIPGKQVSVVAKAAYRSGERLKDERIDKAFNYRARSQEVVHSEIVTPDAAPDWMHSDRGRLWNAIEQAEKRKDSQLAREFILALPVELTPEQQAEVVRGWCEAEIAKTGCIADFSLHRSHDGNNPHAHVLFTLRPVEGEGFGLKPSTAGKFNGRGDVGKGAKSDLENWRESWAAAENKALEAAGLSVRVDHRSLVDQGIDRTPQPKIGTDATAMKRRGVEPDPERVKLARWAVMENYIRPVMRALQGTGEVKQHGAGETWWERAQVAVEWGMETGRELWRDQSSGGRAKDPPAREARSSWQDYVLTRQKNEPDRGPEMEPGR